MLNLIHITSCGRRWIGTECITEAWTDVRQPFRIIHILAAIRMLANGTSLLFQYNYPNSSFMDRGNKQLFVRSLIKGSGIFIHVARGYLKPTLLAGTEFERLPIESLANFTRAFILLPIISGSLMHQWYTTIVPKAQAELAAKEALKRVLSDEN